MSWVGLIAEFEEEPEMGAGQVRDRRQAARRQLRFESVVAAPRSPARVVVLDLTRDGMMLHTDDAMEVGDSFAVDLPEAGSVEASVVWKRTSLYGCQFAKPVSRAAISATLLKATPDRPKPRRQKAR